MLSSAENRAARRIHSSNLPAEFLVEMARSIIRSNYTMRTWRMLPEDVSRLIEAHGVQDARFFAAEVIVWHGGSKWNLEALKRVATARGIEH